ncbi:uncharacterized protein LOC112575302 isoform X1 [Pomacea canaliculata]|uniref:uncharacterized protein LOC112575302 isoform X1 n=1 Tax=Pomacea canaliculata TaxID=400727 RepID=UPI000D733DEB|nr:uncharacterized protein LOC112575302 isoform X1 [Pomacea canaliculata]
MADAEETLTSLVRDTSERSVSPDATDNAVTILGQEIVNDVVHVEAEGRRRDRCNERHRSRQEDEVNVATTSTVADVDSLFPVKLDNNDVPTAYEETDTATGADQIISGKAARQHRKLWNHYHVRHQSNEAKEAGDSALVDEDSANLAGLVTPSQEEKGEAQEMAAAEKPELHKPDIGQKENIGDNIGQEEDIGDNIGQEEIPTESPHTGNDIIKTELDVRPKEMPAEKPETGNDVTTTQEKEEEAALVLGEVDIQGEASGPMLDPPTTPVLSEEELESYDDIAADIAASSFENGGERLSARRQV